MDDLTLKELGQFYGTQAYHKLSPLFKTLATDGIKYIMENGYSWVVTDALAVIETKLSKEEFIAIHLIVKNGKAVIKLTDGNEKVFHKQEYDMTNAKRELTLFCTNNVIMLTGEY